LSALAGGGEAFRVKLVSVSAPVFGRPALPASSLARAARSGSSRGAWGYRSPAMMRRRADVTAASSSSGRSIVGTARRLSHSETGAKSLLTISQHIRKVAGKDVRRSSMDRALWFRCGISSRKRTLQLERLRVQLPPARPSRFESPKFSAGFRPTSGLPIPCPASRSMTSL
jgi:hypothetical protein